MEWVQCAICGSQDSEIVLEGWDFDFGATNEIFQVVRCLSCGLVYTNPRPTSSEMIRYYHEGYGPYHLTVSKRNIRSYWIERLKNAAEGAYLRRYRGEISKHDIGQLFLAWLGRRLYSSFYSKLPPYRTQGRLLDVGCGSGIFLWKAKRAGWECVGLDLTFKPLVTAKERWGINVFQAKLPLIGMTDRSCDVVTMWAVLEHMHDPIASLLELKRVIRKDGLLILSVPDISTIETHWFGPYWYAWKLPRHLYHFTPETLTKILRNGGFEVIAIEHEPNLLNLLGSIRNALSAPQPYGRIARRLVWINSLPEQILRFLGIVWGKLGQSGRMMVLAKVKG